jgi:hypothetical protein
MRILFPQFSFSLDSILLFLASSGGITKRCLDISKQRLLIFSFYFIGRKKKIRLKKKFSPILIVIEDENERIYFYPQNGRRQNMGKLVAEVVLVIKIGFQIYYILYRNKNLLQNTLLWYLLFFINYGL